MKSATPKVLHSVAGRSLLGHVVHAVKQLSPQELRIVVGSGREAVEAHIADIAPKATTIFQEHRGGTGHATQLALAGTTPKGTILILAGDTPLLSGDSLAQFVAAHSSGKFAASVLTAEHPDPTGYGRIIRDDSDELLRIVEEKDANAEIRQITEINTGFMALPTEKLKHWLKPLKPNNAQGEYYLTDVIALAVAEGVPVYTTQASNDWETVGVNSRAQLADLERVWQRELANRLLESGVTLLDPSRIDIRGELQCGTDVKIDIGCVFEGKVVLGSGVSIGPHCVIKDAVIDANAKIQAFSHIDQATVGAGSVIGPYARLRPGTVLAEEVHVGNFVEIKNSDVGAHSKANHLAYVGDATIGKKVNIGAGTITCNYDGVNKHRTVIEDEAFIGSDTQLVAPVTVGKGAILGAGTTLTKDAPANQLTVTRVKQVSLNWQKPTKKSK